MWKLLLSTAWLLLAACSHGAVDARVEPLSRAALTSAGLGDVHVGETTLGEFVDRYGTGRVDLIASDDIGYELVFARGELAFLFLLGSDGRKFDTDLMRPGMRDLPKLLANHPEFRELRLASLTIAAGESREESFFQGRFDGSIGLFDSMYEAAGRIGIPDEERPPMLAGLSPSLPRTIFHFAERGLVLYGDRPDGAAADEPWRILRITLYATRNP